MEINLTGTDVHSVSPFPCSLPVPNYSVGPDGAVSACTIAFNDSRSDAAGRYQIGRVTEEGLTLDAAAIEALRGLHVLSMPGCARCHAKWHCRGGCLYAKGPGWSQPLAAERCDLVRNVVARKLLALATEAAR
jgi:radical SAM protein with 4Fe4S-binding SPASM domain